MWQEDIQARYLGRTIPHLRSTIGAADFMRRRPKFRLPKCAMQGNSAQDFKVNLHVSHGHHLPPTNAPTARWWQWWSRWSLSRMLFLYRGQLVRILDLQAHISHILRIVSVISSWWRGPLQISPRLNHFRWSIGCSPAAAVCSGFAQVKRREHVVLNGRHGVMVRVVKKNCQCNCLPFLYMAQHTVVQLHWWFNWLLIQVLSQRKLPSATQAAHVNLANVQFQNCLCLLLSTRSSEILGNSVVFQLYKTPSWSSLKRTASEENKIVILLHAKNVTQREIYMYIYMYVYYIV